MRLSIVIGVTLLSVCGYVQTPNKFESEIRAFEQQDRQSPPAAGGIVFTGSSSIRLWQGLQQAFSGKPVIPRGFGGSELTDVLHFADRIITPYRPRQVILYCGGNDIANGGQSAQQTYERFVRLFRHVRTKLPAAQFTYISIAPNPARRKFQPVVDETNRRIRRFLAHRRNTQYVDVGPAMLGTNGQPRGALFTADSLHMNAEGYRVWTAVLRPYLK